MGANDETLEQVMRRPRGPRERLEATTLELARRFAPELGVRKLLLRIGIRARDADRWLARRVVLESAGLGESWLAMELAKLTSSDPERVREAPRELERRRLEALARTARPAHHLLERLVVRAHGASLMRRARAR
ncbi:MAG: hypothetical protein K8H88_09380, partial [Sandaracinaceae bacterium]|nr:hypothetical protein [Sandaracinaceae bacterium]